MANFEIYLKDFSERYADLLAKQDSNNMHLLLKEPIPEFDSSEGRMVASLHQQKARAYALFAENSEMDRHFEAAVNLIDQVEAWKLYLDWANLYLMQLRVPQLQENPQLIFENALRIIKRVSLVKLKKDRYALWAVSSFQAFCELAVSTHKSLPSVFETLDFSPIPLSLINNHQKIKEFYAHFFKSIAVAIELRDEVLLLKLLKMISIDDALIMGEATLLNKFQQTLNDSMDMRPEFAAEFSFIYAAAPVLISQFPNLNLFISYIEKQNFGGLLFFYHK
ncbi:MAG: hypothetical protein PF484_15255 [Bacteroidales bacterium]|jgi:hypothetical protein|nr:hypothetical protein [Bacteroidales bacterium]